MGIVFILGLVGFAACGGAIAAHGVSVEMRLRSLRVDNARQASELEQLRADFAAFRARRDGTVKRADPPK